MKRQANLAKSGLEIDKSYGTQKSFGSPPEPQKICQYKFYPAYLTAKVIQMKSEDVKRNEAASRSIAEKLTELQQRSLVG